MSIADLQTKLPRFTVPTIAGLLGVSLVYSVVVEGDIISWLAVWSGLVSIGIGLFAVYLFYRLVLAVERFVDNQ